MYYPSAFDYINYIKGDPKGTGHGNQPIFSTEFRKFLHIFRISEIGVLADTEILYFDISDGYFEIIGTEIGNHTPWEPPLERIGQRILPD